MINVVCGIRSTGRICTDLAKEYEKHGHEVKIAYGREEVPKEALKYAVRIGSDWDVRLHALHARIFDSAGFGSKRVTTKFIEWVRFYDPDEIHLHNIHGYFINIEILFQYLRECGKRIKWTLHDCWAFTGHCVYFTMVKCNRWQSICHECPNKKEYPASYLTDRSDRNFQVKRKLFTDIPNMVLITPSKWLADLVKQSFLSKYPVEVRYNSVDTNVFKPTCNNFREQYGLQNKTILLGVASTWDRRKGLDDFIELSHMLDDRYAIILVGLTEKEFKRKNKRGATISTTIEKRPLSDSISSRSKTINKNIVTYDKGSIGGSIVIEEGAENLYYAITGSKWDGVYPEDGTPRVICIPTTSSSVELAMWYTVADLFLNPTHEDNYPTVNLEAAACGTPVITYNVGGAAETIQGNVL